jgi:hypothetical protein
MLILFVLLLVIIAIIVFAVPPAGSGKNWAVLLLAGLAFVLVAIQLVKTLT